MNCIKKFRVKPGSKVRLSEIDPDFSDKDEDKKSSVEKIAKLQEQMNVMQYRLFAEQKRSLLVVLQALDAGGRDDTIRHVFGTMNPQGCRVAGFKQASAEQLSHDFYGASSTKLPSAARL